MMPHHLHQPCANRIDRNTGGIVIAAKTAEALRILNDKIKGPRDGKAVSVHRARQTCRPRD